MDGRGAVDPDAPGDVVHVPAAVCHQYVACSRFNSPYPAHDRGCAVDLYPAEGAPSPVAGEVVVRRRVRAPSRPWAEPHDHLVVVDTGEHLARLLHVEPRVADGDRVEVGDDLGRLVRSGYFAPWVDDHLHLGFRPRGADPVRASGSLPVELDVDVEPVAWNGTGTVVETGDTYAVLDAPGHPAPGERFAGIAASAPDGGAGTSGGGSNGGSGAPLDGGLPHYPGAGWLGGDSGPISLLGTTVGEALDGQVSWADVEVRANGQPVTGLSMGVHRERLGAKLVSWDGPPAAVGEPVTVTIDPR